MRVVVLGGTKFVGRAITEGLVAGGDEVMVVHRGESEPPDLPAVRHLHTDRAALRDHRAEIDAFAPEAAVEVFAMDAAATQAALDVLPHGIPLVAISSGDVYRAYEGLHTGRQTDALPLAEDSPLRTRRFVDGSEFENLEVEAPYLARGAAVLRLGMVYGPHDEQRRFEPILRRVRAGRSRIPMGSGLFLFSRVYAPDIARAVKAALTDRREAAAGEAFNLVERRTPAMALFASEILAAAGDAATGTELVRVRDDLLPSDLALFGGLPQHLLMDAEKARRVLGWSESPPEDSLRASVAWHLAHPPDEWSHDFSADDSALQQAASGSLT